MPVEWRARLLLRDTLDGLKLPQDGRIRDFMR
jgi:hypothetical protein